MDLGRVGIWTYHLNFQPTSKVRDVVAELEALGYGAIWVGEAAYREPLASAAVLLSATSRMVIATGIANIWVRDPFATLARSSPWPRPTLSGSCSAWASVMPAWSKASGAITTASRSPRCGHISIRWTDSPPATGPSAR